MDEYAKIRIAFSVGLLAVLLTGSNAALSAPVGGINIFGWDYGILDAYLIVTVSVGVATYLYGTAIVLPERAAWTLGIGDGAFAFALLIPPASLAVWVLQLAMRSLPPISTTLIFLITSIVGGALGGATVVGAIVLQRSVRKRSKEAESFRRILESDRYFTEAKMLLKEDMVEPSVMEGFKSLEQAATQWLSNRGELRLGPRVESPVNALARQPDLTHIHDDLTFVRDLRNRAAHTIAEISRREAEIFLGKVESILRELLPPDIVSSN